MSGPCLKVGEYLDLRSLWKHVERRDRIDCKSLLQLFQVTRKSWRIAGNVNQRFRSKICYRIANPFSESCRRWIDDHCCGGARRGERPGVDITLPQSGWNGRLYTLPIPRAVRFLFSGVLFRGGDSKPVPINPNHALEFVEQCFCEKSGTAVSVD